MTVIAIQQKTYANPAAFEADRPVMEAGGWRVRTKVELPPVQPRAKFLNAMLDAPGSGGSGGAILALLVTLIVLPFIAIARLWKLLRRRRRAQQTPPIVEVSWIQEDGAVPVSATAGPARPFR